MKSGSAGERLFNGLWTENPVLMLMLGLCPTLAVTTSVSNGIGMGLSSLVVLTLSNVVISILRNVIPDGVRMPAFIVVVASFVTLVQFLLQAYLPAINDSLGVYIPLIVVNCIILGRAEAYASKNGVVSSFFDGIGMGLGFTVSLILIAAVRELLGSGSITLWEGIGVKIIPSDFNISIFILAPGAFFVLALLAGIQNKFQLPAASNGPAGIRIACGGDCGNCFDSQCADNHGLVAAERERIAKEAAAAKAAKAAAKKAEKELKGAD